MVMIFTYVIVCDMITSTAEATERADEEDADNCGRKI